MRTPVLLPTLLGLASLSCAFDRYKAFRFGQAPVSGSSRDQSWAITPSGPDGYFVAGGVDDSTCCVTFPTGSFGAPNGLDRVLSHSRFDSTGLSLWRKLTWGSFPGVRWFDLAPSTGGAVLSAGTQGDTVLFTGSYRVSHKTSTPSTIPSSDRRAVIGGGGGGGWGVARWSATGDLLWNGLFRLQVTSGSTVATAWNVSSGASDEITVSGRISTTSATQGWWGSDSFPVPSGSSCFLFGSDANGGSPWWRAFAGPSGEPGFHAFSPTRLWLAAADTAPGMVPSSVVGNYTGWRPRLRSFVPTTGATQAELSPLLEMQGSFRGIAAHENGSLLLQAEQASSFFWNGQPRYPQVDTLSKVYGIQRTSVLALLDSTGILRGFRSLKGLANASAWKVRRAPGRGWLLLTWDELGFFGWSRLYLLDDSLNLLETSDTLPMATDVELGSDGRIVLTGIASSSTVNPPWLTGTGTMWAGRVHFQTPAVDTMPPILVAVSPTPGAMVPGPAGREILVTYRNNGVLKSAVSSLVCASGVCGVSISDTGSNGRRGALTIPLAVIATSAVADFKSSNPTESPSTSTPIVFEYSLGIAATCSLRVWPTSNRGTTIAMIPLGGASAGVNTFSWDGTWDGSQISDGDYAFTLVVNGRFWRDSASSYVDLDTAWGGYPVYARSRLWRNGWTDISINAPSLSIVNIWISRVGKSRSRILSGRILQPGQNEVRIFNYDLGGDSVIIADSSTYSVLVNMLPLSSGIHVKGRGPASFVASTRFNPFYSHVISGSVETLSDARAVCGVRLAGSTTEMAWFSSNDFILNPRSLELSPFPGRSIGSDFVFSKAVYSLHLSALDSSSLRSFENIPVARK
jgi:hypothetical protein